MSKEIYISSTPHETRLAIVEEEALSEIYYERENEYTLAGSIYNGRVTRVLPGMQSAFVDIGLDRDAFLYITDFLEETADTEDFDTAAPRNGGDRSGERGGRGRRGGRDRQQHAAELPASDQRSQHEFSQSDATSADSESADTGSAQDIGEGAPGADGSRRWRGRRGRRRGRGGHAGNLGRTPSQTEADDQSELSSADAASEAPSAFGDSDYIERQSPSEQPRGRRERGQRQDRFPRGFTPSRGELYGIHGEEPSGTGPIENAYGDIHAGSSAEALILPGESLSKYRKPGDEPPRDSSALITTPANAAPAPSASLTPLAPPATLYTSVASGWDGGDVLPGETLSRRSAPAPRRSEPAAVTPPPAAQPEPEPIHEPFAAPAEAAVIADAPEAAEPKFSVEELEYEPEEASASFRIDPAPPREFRNAPVIEPPVELQNESANAAAHDEAEAAPHDITSIAPTGEMHSEPELVADEIAASTSERNDETSPMHHEQAIVSAEVVDGDAAIWPVELTDGSEPREVTEEEPPATLHASSIEEIDDEEETLEGAADLGVMLREMSIDHITRSDSATDELEEDSLEEIEEFESSRDYTESTEEAGPFSEAAAEDEDEYSEASLEDEHEAGGAVDTVADEPAPARHEHERRGRRD
ncbi:MAG TPA: hypothetical protein VF221_08520, partial [Chloroflexota bacterium]